MTQISGIKSEKVTDSCELDTDDQCRTYAIRDSGEQHRCAIADSKQIPALSVLIYYGTLESDFFNPSIIRLPSLKDGGFGAAASGGELSRGGCAGQNGGFKHSSL
jgi:hypothetical protein